MQVFVEMRRKGCPPDFVMYDTLASTFCKAGRLSQGYKFLDAMSRDALPVDTGDWGVPWVLCGHEKEQLDECLEKITSSLVAYGPR
jgi:pentatricopeptide repeat protein